MGDDATLKELIGTRTQVSTVVIERGPVRFFADSVFDESPESHDPAAAEAAGVDGIEVAEAVGRSMLGLPPDQAT